MTLSNDTTRDLELKLITSRIFKALGYSTWLEIDYFAHTYTTKYGFAGVTDLDVLGIAFDADFSHRVLGAECKSPEEKGAEDVLKLLGVAELFRVHRSYLVKEKIADNARDIAAQHGVICLDHVEATKFLKSLEADHQERLIAENVGYQSWSNVLRMAKVEAGFGKMLRYIERDFWIRDHWENIHNLLFLVQQVFVPSLKVITPEHKAVAIELCRLFNLSILQLCHAVLRSHSSDIEREIEIQLFGGSKQRRDRERLYDEIAKALPRKKKLPNPLNPPYLSKLKELVSYYFMSPFAASKTPNCLQRALYEIYLNNKSMYSGTFVDSFSPVVIKLAKDSSEVLMTEESGNGKELLKELLVL